MTLTCLISTAQQEGASVGNNRTTRRYGNEAVGPIDARNEGDAHDGERRIHDALPRRMAVLLDGEGHHVVEGTEERQDRERDAQADADAARSLQPRDDVQSGGFALHRRQGDGKTVRSEGVEETRDDNGGWRQRRGAPPRGFSASPLVTQSPAIRGGASRLLPQSLAPTYKKSRSSGRPRKNPGWEANPPALVLYRVGREAEGAARHHHHHLASPAQPGGAARTEKRRQGTRGMTTGRLPSLHCSHSFVMGETAQKQTPLFLVWWADLRA